MTGVMREKGEAGGEIGEEGGVMVLMMRRGEDEGQDGANRQVSG